MKKLLTFAVMMSLAVTLSGCDYTKKDSPTNTTGTTGGTTSVLDQKFVKGVTLSPKSFQGGDFNAFFTKAVEGNQIISWHGDINDLTKSNNAAATIVDLAKQKKYTPLIEVTYFNGGTGDLLRPLTTETKKSYQDTAVKFLKEHPVQYFGIGIEVDKLYLTSATNWQDFVTFFGEMADVIHREVPGTVVFPTFQLERMKGLNGGLYGGKNDPAKNTWALLDQFPAADAVAFTTYPMIIYKSPSDLGDTYYSEINDHTKKPVLFTEVGWYAKGITGWDESSEAEQAAFVDRFFALTKSVEPRVMIWSFLYDQQVGEPFTSLGFFDRDGKERQAWATWKSK